MYKILTSENYVTVEKTNPITGNKTLFSDPSFGNRHWLEYQEWLKDGGQPEIINISEQLPANEPTIEDRIKASEMLINLLLQDSF